MHQEESQQESVQTSVVVKEVKKRGRRKLPDGVKKKVVAGYITQENYSKLLERFGKPTKGVNAILEDYFRQGE